MRQRARRLIVKNTRPERRTSASSFHTHRPATLQNPSTAVHTSPSATLTLHAPLLTFLGLVTLVESSSGPRELAISLPITSFWPTTISRRPRRASTSSVSPLSTLDTTTESTIACFGRLNAGERSTSFSDFFGKRVGLLYPRYDSAPLLGTIWKGVGE